jgi:hypothetical protein
MRALGHTNAQTAMIYQHPSLERVRAIVNERLLQRSQTRAGMAQSTSQRRSLSSEMFASS